MGNLSDTVGAETSADQRAGGESAMREVLECHFIKSLELPPAAISWLLDLWDFMQFMDDVADGDDIQRNTFNAALYKALVQMPLNLFFSANSQSLLPVMATAILKWQASDALERSGKADARTYMWRAGYYDVVMLSVQLCHGHDRAIDIAPNVLSLYGEKLEDYKKEFSYA
jgi:hypothetical protein